MFKKKTENKIVMFNKGLVEFMNDISSHKMKRERGVSPEGEAFNHRWVLRVNGEYVDHDMYIEKLAERNGIILEDDRPEPPPPRNREES